MKKFIIILLAWTICATGFAQCPVTISAGGPTSFCKGGSVLLTASNGVGYTWQWKKNGSNLAGATSQTYSVTSSGSYTVFVTTTGGCTSTSTAIIVTVTLDNAGISANGGFIGPACLNGGANLVASTGAGYSWQWKLNGNNINGAISSGYLATAAGAYTCQISIGNCSVLSNTLTAALQVATIHTSDPTIFCTGSATLSTTVNFGTNPGITYQWKNNGVDIPGATSASYSAATSGQFTCIVTNAGFCNASTAPSNSIGVQAGVPPQISVTATTGAWPVNLCNGQTIDLQINDISNGQIWPGGVADWYKDGQSWQPFGGNMLTGVNESGIYNAYITTTCGISFAQNGIPVISLDPANPPVINNNGITSNCSSIFLYVDPASVSFTPYQWKRNGIDIPGETGATMYATITGNYSCLVSNACTTMVTAPVTATITGPVAHITPQGSTSICSGTSVLLDGTSAGASGYQWYLNNVSLPGATNASYAASAAGSYYVKVTSVNCGFVNSTPVTVTVNATPSPNITPNGSTTFCSGGNVTLSVSNSIGATYKWKINNIVINGATSSSYTATAAGSYTVVKTNASGCKGTSGAVQVTVNSLPNTSATAQGSTTFCAGDSVQLKTPLNNFSYQWKRNNANINGAILNKYEAKIAGNYKVKVTNANGCTAVSNTVTVTVPCRENVGSISNEENNKIVVFPNPSTESFMLTGNFLPGNAVTIIIYDVLGKEIKSEIIRQSDGYLITIPIAGVYYAIIKKEGNYLETLKLIKLNQ